MAQPRVKGILTAEDRSGAAFDSVNKRLRKMELGFRSLGGRAKALGQGLTLGVTAPLVGIGVTALKTAGSFEASMNRVEAKAKVAGVPIKQLEEQAKTLGRTTQFSAREAANAQEILATSGFNTAQIFRSLPGVLDLAAAGTLGLADAAGFTSATLKSFNLESSKSGDIADLLAKGSLLANQTVADLGAGMAKAGATANAFGIAIEDTAASLSALAEKNVRAEEGGIAFRNFLLELKSPTSTARKYLDDLGLSITNADGSLKSINEILRIFNKAGITAANATDVFQKRVASTFIQLEQAQGSISKFNDELEDRTGTAAKIAAKNLEGLNGELTKLKSAFEGFQIALADAGLLDSVTKLVAGLGNFVSKMAETNKETLRAGLIAAGFAASIGPVIYLLGQFTISLGALAGLKGTLASIGTAFKALSVAGPIGLAIAAVAGLIAIAAKADREFRKFFASMTSAALRDLRDTFAPLWSGLVGLFKGAVIPVAIRLGKVFGVTLAVSLRVVAYLLKTTLLPAFKAVEFVLATAIPAAVGVVTRAFDVLWNLIEDGIKRITGPLKDLLWAVSIIPGSVGRLAGDLAVRLEAVGSGIRDTGKEADGAAAKFQAFGSATEAWAKNAALAIGKARELTKEIEILGRAPEPFATKAALEEGNRLEAEKKKLEEEKKRQAELVKKNPFEDLRAKPKEPPKITVEPVFLEEPIAKAGTKLDGFLKQFEKAIPIIRDVGDALTFSLSGALDLFNQDSRTTWEIFSSSAKSAINSIAQEILNKLLRGALASLLSLIPGVGPVLGALFSARTSTPGTQSEASSRTVILQENYSALLPANTNDYVRANVAGEESRRRAERFLLGGKLLPGV